MALATEMRVSSCRFNAEIDFNGSKLVERYMQRQDVSHMKSRFKLAASSPDDAEFSDTMKSYGTQIVSIVGAEVRDVCPAAMHFCIAYREQVQPASRAPRVVWAAATARLRWWPLPFSRRRLPTRLWLPAVILSQQGRARAPHRWTALRPRLWRSCPV